MGEGGGREREGEGGGREEKGDLAYGGVDGRYPPLPPFAYAAYAGLHPSVSAGCRDQITDRPASGSCRLALTGSISRLSWVSIP